MKKNKAEHFNDSASDVKSQSQKIINSLNIQKGQNIVDFGSGGGYYSNKFANLVGSQGKVYAVDVNKDLLNYIKRKSKFNNIHTILYDGSNLNFDPKSIDIIFMRNVTHHLKKRANIFEKLSQFLKKNGKIVIIDYKKGKLLSFHGLFGHYVRKEPIIKEMDVAGLKLAEEYDFLGHQHFLIFKLK